MCLSEGLTGITPQATATPARDGTHDAAAVGALVGGLVLLMSLLGGAAAVRCGLVQNVPTFHRPSGMLWRQVNEGREMAVQLFQGINVVSIAVPDLDRGREFYRDVLGLGPPLYDLPEAGWIEFATGAPGGNLALTLAAPGWASSTGTTVVFNTLDCHSSCAALRDRGVACDDPVVFPGYVTYCSFYDPFGNRLQMCSPAPAPTSPE